MELTEEQINNNYNRFMDLLKTNVHREGIDSLLAWLGEKDTKIAPASTRYHLSCAGGLLQHCLGVYDRLKKLMVMEYGDKCPYTEETITLVALLHDISKINFYEVSYRNTKDETGNWVKVPFYQVKEEQNRFIFGSHAMNSYYMLNTFVKLTYEEALAVLHHMGGLDSTEDTLTIKNISEAYKKSTLAVLLHEADLLATFVDERE